MDLLNKYFPGINHIQYRKLHELVETVTRVNKSINVVSRTDIDNLMERHILPALAISKVKQFDRGDRVLDIGSGGGFPGLALAILFPEVEFTLIDSRAKKCEAIEIINNSLKLNNVSIEQVRSNEFKEECDYVVGRAVTNPESFIKLAKKNIKTKDDERIFYISGGERIESIRSNSISDYYEGEYYKDKYIYVS